ncbi:MAG: SDR family oxidoreductase [Pseudomonadota bacterium]
MFTAYTLVTGASLGIGREIARVAARNGRNLILTARSADRLEALAEELRAAHGVTVVVIPADLSVAGEAAAMWDKAVAEGRRVDFLVNNAGLGSHGAFAEADWARKKRSIEVNVLALTELCKLAAEHMERGGRILNVASIASFVPGPAMAVYHATKAYVLSLSLALNEEFRGRITVTTLCPGVTESNFLEDAEMHDVRFINAMRKLPTAASVAEYGYAAAIGGRAVVVPGLMNKMAPLLSRLLPRTLQAKIMRQMFGTL